MYREKYTRGCTVMRKEKYLLPFSWFFFGVLGIMITNIICYGAFRIYYFRLFQKEEVTFLKSISNFATDSDKNTPIPEIETIFNGKYYVVDKNGHVTGNIANAEDLLGKEIEAFVKEKLDDTDSPIFVIGSRNGLKLIFTCLPLSNDCFLIHDSRYSEISYVYNIVGLRLLILTFILSLFMYFITEKSTSKFSVLSNLFKSTVKNSSNPIERENHRLAESIDNDAPITIKEPESSTPVPGILDYLELNYSNPDINASFMADYFHITPSYFSRIFGKETGSSFPDYLLDLRMKKACELLISDTDTNIITIAQSVGYLNASYFTSQFKKKYGQTPTQFRKNALAANI